MVRLPVWSRRSRWVAGWIGEGGLGCSRRPGASRRAGPGRRVRPTGRILPGRSNTALNAAPAWGVPLACRFQNPSESVPPAQPTALVQPPVGGFRVRFGRGADSGAFLPQFRQRHPLRQVGQPLGLTGIGRGGGGDRRRLRRGQLPAAHRLLHRRLLGQPRRGVQRLLRRPAELPDRRPTPPPPTVTRHCADASPRPDGPTTSFRPRTTARPGQSRPAGRGRPTRTPHPGPGCRPHRRSSRRPAPPCPGTCVRA
jgi:hypothetical protein